VEEQTGTEKVLEEQKETTQVEESTLEEQEETTPEVTGAETDAQNNAPDVDADAAEVNTDEGQDSDEDIEPQVPEKPKNPNAKWYILQAFSGYEGRVEQTIQEKLKIEGLEDLVNEIFIPSEDVIRTKDGKNAKSIKNIFRDMC